LLDVRWQPAGVVGYNVRAAVDTEQHLIIAHEVTNSVSDRAGLRIATRIATKISSVLKLAHDTLIRLVSTSHAVLKLTVSLWQLLSDSACPSWNVQVGIKKYSLTDLEFISRHSAPHANRIIICTICALASLVEPVPLCRAEGGGEIERGVRCIRRPSGHHLYENGRPD
jgi:hypothetical protein